MPLVALLIAVIVGMLTLARRRMSREAITKCVESRRSVAGIILTAAAGGGFKQVPLVDSGIGTMLVPVGRERQHLCGS